MPIMPLLKNFDESSCCSNDWGIMQTLRAKAERLWKGFLNFPCSNFNCRSKHSRTLEPSHKQRSQWLWIHTSCNISCACGRPEIARTINYHTMSGLPKARDAHKEEEENGHMKSVTGCAWRMVSLAEALPFLEKGLLPKPSINDLAHILQRCRRERDHEHALEWYAYILKNRLEIHSLLGNHLVLMLVDVGRIHDARQVFDALLDGNNSSWNSLIAGYVKCGKPQHALTLYYEMKKNPNLYPLTHTFVALLKACAKLNNLEIGILIHVEVAITGLLQTNFCVGSALVNMYAECGSLAKARQVFDNLQIRNAVSWNALIAAYVKHGHGEEALKCFEQMRVEEGVVPSSVTFLCALKACGSTGAVSKGQEIHAELARIGLLERDLVAGNTLVDMYAKCGFLAKAEDVFNELPIQDVVSWNALISGYAEHELDEEVLHRFEEMQLKGLSPDAVTFACSLKSCGNLGAIHKGEEIHAEIARKGWLFKDRVVGNMLVVMYAKCGLVAQAQQVFDKFLVRDVIAWNALISGYADIGCNQEALECFEQMESEGVYTESVTFIGCLKACGSLEATAKGQELHAEIERRGLLEKNVFLGSALVDMYAKSGLLPRAQQVFDKLLVQNIVAWTALILGYAEQGLGEQALECYEQMQLAGVTANAVTFVGVLKACGSIGALDKGEEIHRKVEGLGLLESNIVVGSTLVDMYSKCGLLSQAKQVFNKLPIRDAVAWTALVSGYAENGQGEEALTTFERMQHEGVSPDAVTLVCMLKACGSIGAANKGVEIHAEMARKGLLERAVVGSTLVDMYGKCGAQAIAQEVFDKLLVRDVVAWNTLIAGYAQLKESTGVFHTFDRMLAERINPDPVTFIIVLNACSRAGLFDKSQTYFEAMSKKYGLFPMVEHHNCMVDILSHAGQLDKAIALTMKTHSNLVGWRNVLEACKNWGSVDIGLQAFQQAMFSNDSVVPT